MKLRLTAAQFLVCAGPKESKSKLAAFFVLVEGLSPSEAAKKAGCSRQACSNAIRRIVDADGPIRRAYSSAPVI